jgi:transmembrane sensor
MANVVRFPRTTNVQEAAAQWVARLDRGLSDAERRELARWLEADPSRRGVLLELAELWDELDVLSELSALFPLEQPQRSPESRRGRWPWTGLAAASVACVALGLAVWNRDGGDQRQGSAPVAAAIVHSLGTVVGARTDERLPDGSLVRLNTDTEIEIRYTEAGRTVSLLRGEAHFDVARDSARPFNVEVAGRVVQAVGTAFNVRLKSADEVEVIVTEGRVKVGRLEPPAAPARNPVPVARFDATLVEGQAVLLQRSFGPSAAQQITAIAREDIDVKLAWQRDMLIFRGAPLDEVLKEFERYTTTVFVLEDERLGSERIGGTLSPGRVEELLGLLHDNLGIESERIEGDRFGGERILLREAARQ